MTLRLDLHPVAIIRHNKLSQQKLPPCEIIKVLSGGRALELNLPESMDIHPIVSVQQVERSSNPAKDPWKRDYPRPQAVDEDREIFKAEIIGDKTLRNGSKKYKVHWIGYPSSDDQWLRQMDVTDDLVKEYEEKQRVRRQELTVTAIDSKIMAQTLIATGIHDMVKSMEDTPFTYEIRLPREG